MGWFSKFFKGGNSSGKSPEEIVHFYQQLGFFAGISPASLVERYANEHGKPPQDGNPWDDAYLLACDEDLVWTCDPEADVCAENNVYAEILPQWASISHGAFRPEKITEHWESDDGPVTVSFQLNGQVVTMSPGCQNDWIDLAVLWRVNSMIEPAGCQFEYAVDGNFAIVLCLTPEQKQMMQARRSFPFAS